MAQEKEFKEDFGLRFYKDGKIQNINSGKEVGYISNSGDYSIYLPTLKTTYKAAIVMLAVWKNNGILPDMPRKWKILYKDGDKLNCSLDNLDYVDITDNPYKTPDEANENLYNLKLKKVKLIEQIEELDEQILDLTWMIASGEKRINRVARMEEDKQRLIDSRKTRPEPKSPPPSPKAKHKKPSKTAKRKIGTSYVYLVDKFSQTYEELSTQQAAEKLGLAASSIATFASKNMTIPSNPKYALTRNLGDTWDLMG